MNNIADLVTGRAFGAGRPVRAPIDKLLKNRMFLSSAGAILLAASYFAFWPSAHGKSGNAPIAPPPMSVSVASVEPRAVRIWSDFSGRLTAVDAAEIRPEVAGRVTEIRFKDGQAVKAGDVLLVIDPRPYQAAVAKAEANLATANTNAKLADLQLSRGAKLLKAQFLSQSGYDQLANARIGTLAAVKAAQAMLAEAKLDIDRAFVKAPIAGRAGRAEITVGNLVGPGANAPLLTTIVSDAGIYADFDVDEQTYMQTVRPNAATAKQEAQVPVELITQGDADTIFKGTIQSFDNQIDTRTGTIRARARFENADGRLVPGMFVSVRMASSSDKKALLVPEEAIGNDQNKRFVYVVGQDKRATFREVRLGQHVNGKRVVLSGLQPGERIIIEGVQLVQPGALVAPHIATADASMSQNSAAR